MISRQIDKLSSLVLLDRLELLLHRRSPCWIALPLNIGSRLVRVREVQLGEEPLRLSWWSPVADDVRHHAVAERLIIVERV